MNDSRDRFVVIGKAVRPFGIRGEIKISVYTESFDAFTRSPVLIFDKAPYRVTRIRAHKGAILAILEGIETPEQAMELVGKLVKIDAAHLPPPEEDEYYWFQLIGMKVSTTDGRNLGEITRITPTGANDVLHVEGPLGEVLIPLIEDVVVSVDTGSNLMVVDPLEGLLPDA